MRSFLQCYSQGPQPFPLFSHSMQEFPETANEQGQIKGITYAWDSLDLRNLVWTHVFITGTH